MQLTELWSLYPSLFFSKQALHLLSLLSRQGREKQWNLCVNEFLYMYIDWKGGRVSVLVPFVYLEMNTFPISTEFIVTNKVNNLRLHLTGTQDFFFFFWRSTYSMSFIITSVIRQWFKMNTVCRILVLCTCKIKNKSLLPFCSRWLFSLSVNFYMKQNNKELMKEKIKAQNKTGNLSEEGTPWLILKSTRIKKIEKTEWNVL